MGRRAQSPGVMLIALGAVIAVVFIGVAGVLGAFYLDAEKSTPLMTAILGFIGTTVAAILAVVGGMQYMNGRVNTVARETHEHVESIASETAQKVDKVISDHEGERSP